MLEGEGAHGHRDGEAEHRGDQHELRTRTSDRVRRAQQDRDDPGGQRADPPGDRPTEAPAAARRPASQPPRDEQPQPNTPTATGPTLPVMSAAAAGRASLPIHMPVSEARSPRMTDCGEDPRTDDGRGRARSTPGVARRSAPWTPTRSGWSPPRPPTAAHDEQTGPERADRPDHGEDQRRAGHAADQRVGRGGVVTEGLEACGGRRATEQPGRRGVGDQCLQATLGHGVQRRPG